MNRRARHRRRPGLALVPALVCLVLVAMLGAVTLRLVRSQRRVADDEERRMQTEWLVESGLSRASARLAADPGYAGEKWEVGAPSLGGDAPALVTIAVEAADGGRRRRVRVEAEYPRGESPRRNRLNKRTIVDVGNARPGGPS